MINQDATTHGESTERPLAPSLFDEHGRRIPYEGMRVFNQVSRRYFNLVQPPIDYAAIYGRITAHLHLSPPFPEQRFGETCEAILQGIRADAGLANLAKGVYVPFLCPPSAAAGRSEELAEFLVAVGSSYTARYPAQRFLNLCPGKPGSSVLLAPGSGYEKLEESRKNAYIIGIYFPTSLSEYDLASQRRQMATLPEAVSYSGGQAQIVLSGAVDAAAALIGSPELLTNERSYPNHLCVSALQEPGDPEPIAYTFESYNPGLRFRYRSNILVAPYTQVSEQWSGGLTVFTITV